MFVYCTMLNNQTNNKMKTLKTFDYIERFTILKDTTGLWGSGTKWYLQDNKFNTHGSSVYDLKREAKKIIEKSSED